MDNELPDMENLELLATKEDEKPKEKKKKKKSKTKKEADLSIQKDPVWSDDKMKALGPKIYIYPIPFGYLALFAIFLNSLVVNIGKQKCVTYLKEYLIGHIVLSYTLIVYISILYMSPKALIPESKMVLLAHLMLPLWLLLSTILHAGGSIFMANGTPCIETAPFLYYVSFTEQFLWYLQLVIYLAFTFVCSKKKRSSTKVSKTKAEKKKKDKIKVMEKLEAELDADPRADDDSDDGGVGTTKKDS